MSAPQTIQKIDYLVSVVVFFSSDTFSVVVAVLPSGVVVLVLTSVEVPDFLVVSLHPVESNIKPQNITGATISAKSFFMRTFLSMG